MSKHTYKSGELDMQCNKRAEALFDKAKKLGMINHSTGDGAPNCAMLADAFLYMESDAQIAIVCETSMLHDRLAVADAALAAAREALEKVEAWISHTSGELPEIRECGTYRETLAKVREWIALHPATKEGKAE